MTVSAKKVNLKGKVAKNGQVRSESKGKGQGTPKPKATAKKSPFLSFKAPTAAKAAKKKVAPLTQKGQVKSRVPRYFDPLVNVDVPVVQSDGNAIPVKGLARFDFQHHDEPKLLLVTNNGIDSNVGILLHLTANTPGDPYSVGAVDVLTLPTMTVPAVRGGATAARAMKISCSVINSANGYKRGGRVTTFNTSQRLDQIESSSLGLGYKVSTLVNGIKTNPESRRITGNVLARPAHIIGFPVDTPSYNGFARWEGDHSSTGTPLTPEQAFLTFMAHVTAGDATILSNIGSHATQRPMSTICYMFEPSDDVQDYSITVRANYYTRWPLTTIMGQKQTRIKEAPAHLINEAANKAEAQAQELHALMPFAADM
jgi:hypothetical protein